MPARQKDVLAFAAKLPANQQALVTQYVVEMILGVRAYIETFSEDPSPEGWYKRFALGMDGPFSQGSSARYSAFRSKERAIEFLKAYYAERLPTNDFPGGSRMISVTRNLELVRAAHHISNDDLGLSTADVEKLDRNMRQAWADTAEGLYREVENAAANQFSNQKWSSFGNTAVECYQKLEGIRYAFKQLGHDVESERGYEAIGTTKQEFDRLMLNMAKECLKTNAIVGKGRTDSAGRLDRKGEGKPVPLR